MKKNIISLVGGTAAALALASSAYANPTGTAQIRWSLDGGSTWNATPVVDNGTGDNDNTIDGKINTSIGLGGGFTLNVSSTGNTKPLQGSASAPNMDLGVSGSGSAGGQTVIIEFTDTGFVSPSGSYHTTLGANNTGAIGTSMYTFIGTSAFDGASFLGGVPTGAPGSFIGPIGPLGDFDQGAVDGTAPKNDPYSITIAEVFTLPGNSDNKADVGISVDGRVTSVPDGGNTLMLLGSALSVLGLGAFRRKAAKA
jgi:hypothetical protein